MIYEYAIEPDLVVTWGKNRADYRFFYQHFGLGTSRIMAEFPKLQNWRKQFKQAAAGADDTNEMPRIEELYKLLRERLVRRDGVDYDGRLPWLENAERENIRYEFHAILARTNPRQHKKVLTSEALEVSQLWQVEQQMYCPRLSADMAQLLLPILVNCSEIHFVDPHFGPEKPRYRRPLEAFLDVIAAHRVCRPAITEIIVHTSDEADFDFFRHTCENQLPARIPAGVCLKLKRWKERDGGEKLHNRYILTDIGGVKVDPGLDDGNPGEAFEVMLLNQKLYDKEWNDYVVEPAFESVDNPIIITGANVKNMPF